MAAFALCYMAPWVGDVANPGGYPFGYLAWDGGSNVVGFDYDDFSLQVWNQAFMNAFGR